MIYDPNNPFDISKILFEKPDKWNEVYDSHKRKNFFLLNRRFAIKFPLVANALNLNGVDGAKALDYWATVGKGFGGKTPQFFFTTVANSKKNIAKKKLEYSEDAKKFFIKHFEMSKTDFELCLQLNPTETLKILKEIEINIENDKK